MYICKRQRVLAVLLSKYLSSIFCPILPAPFNRHVFHHGAKFNYSRSQPEFLGFGVPPPAPSWGTLLTGDARRFMFQAPWLILWPGIALSVVVYGVNMFGDALRDILDPRLRGGVGRYGIKAKPIVKKSPKEPVKII